MTPRPPPPDMVSADNQIHVIVQAIASIHGVLGDKELRFKLGSDRRNEDVDLAQDMTGYGLHGQVLRHFQAVQRAQVIKQAHTCIYGVRTRRASVWVCVHVCARMCE